MRRGLISQRFNQLDTKHTQLVMGSHICLHVMTLTLVILHLLQSHVTCVKFSSRQALGTVTDDVIDEASGLAVSRDHSDVMYTHNDKGGQNRIFAVQISSGVRLATFFINNVTNYDWEDLTYGPCVDDCSSGRSCSSTSPPPGRYCIYISDTGDHHGDGSRNNVYMVREPAVLQDGARLDVVDTLMFSWEGPDCETLMITPAGQLYVVSKVKQQKAKIAQLPMSAWGGPRVALDMSQTAEVDVITSHNDPQGGDISPDGTEMLLVFEEEVYYLFSADGDFVKAVNSQTPQRVSNYERVESTEAIAWDVRGQGFYTIAEGKGQTIYYYSKDSDNNGAYRLTVSLTVCLFVVHLCLFIFKM